jgi:D-cysteine desulfhydrase
MPEDLALFRAFPALRHRLPVARCTALPTRVHRLPAYERSIGARELWIKRDDESSPIYGGNKPRKLDFILGDAIARRARGVITFGGIGTNHGLATAVFARQFGLRCILGLVHQPVTGKVRHGLLLAQACGAEMHYAPTIGRLVLRLLPVYAREVLRRQRPYIIPTGGSSTLGVLGFVNAALELKEQIDAGQIPAPDWIVLPAGSGGTLAGLALGCRLAGLTSRVAGVLVTDIFPPGPGRIARLANKAHARLRRLASAMPYAHVAASEITLERGFLGRGYGAPSEAARREREEIEVSEGIAVETAYTGKCLAALRAMAAREPYRGTRLLYWHTYSSARIDDHVGTLPPYRSLPLPFHELFHGPVIPD